MSRIEIRQKLRPYSSLAGIEVPYPSIGRVFQIYPTKVFIDKNEETELAVDWKFSKPVQKITTFFNLIQAKVEVYLDFEKGVLHYELYENAKGLVLAPVRNTMGGASIKVDGSLFKKVALNKEVLLLPTVQKEGGSKEILSLGSHKKQEIEGLLKREDFKEILPILFSLGQMCEVSSIKQAVGHLKVLKEVKKLIESSEHDLILPHLKPLLHSAFSGLFVPHLEDIFYWRGGEELKNAPSSFTLLRELYQLTRSLFIQSNKKELFFLPHLPKELFCGRLLQVEERDLLIDIEWTKKSLRRMRIKALEDVSLQLHFQKPIQKCRVSVNNKPIVFKNKQRLIFEKSKTYIFDRFEK